VISNRYINLLIGVIIFLVCTTLIESSTVGLGIGMVCAMVYLWISQPIPLYITALIPFIIGPAAGILSKEDLASAYGNHMIFLFLGGFIMAVGIEKWKLHEWIAVRLIHLFGSSPIRILFGFMVATAFMSMWISNTATALMMLPMALSVVKTIGGDGIQKYSVGLMLGIAYAANIGGTATIIGTPPNVQLAGILSQEFGIRITFFQWLKIGVPFALIMITIGFFMLRYFFCQHLKLSIPEFEKTQLDSVQKRVLIAFIVVISLWMFGDLAANLVGFSINDTAIAVAGGIAFFIIPGEEAQKPLIVWSDMQRIPWGILILFGGGLAVAKTLANTGVLIDLVNAISSWEIAAFGLIVLFFVLLTVFATELMSNLALVSLVIPIAGTFAEVEGYSILALTSGIALAASCAFMLPVATPPNAILYSSNLIPIRSMVRIGLYMNLIVTVLITVIILIIFGAA